MVAFEDNKNISAGMIIKNLSHQSMIVPRYWEMGMSEFNEFLVRWGWVLDIRPPLIDDESWNLMNKCNNKPPGDDISPIEETPKHPLQELLQALLDNSKLKGE